MLLSQRYYEGVLTELCLCIYFDLLSRTFISEKGNNNIEL